MNAAVPRFEAVAGDALARGLTVRFKAAGFSMWPTIRDGERIVVAPVTVADIGLGDVVLFRSSGRLLAHRVVAIDAVRGRTTLRLRGDAKRGCDAPVDAADVLGRVAAVERGRRVMALQGRIARTRFRLRAGLSRVRAAWRRAAGPDGAVEPVLTSGASPQPCAAR